MASLPFLLLAIRDYQPPKTPSLGGLLKSWGTPPVPPAGENLLHLLLPVQFIELGEYFAVLGDVCHRAAVVLVANHPFFIDYQLSRHAPQLEYFHFLPVQFRYGVIGVGQADEGHCVFVPPVREGLRILRADGDDLGASLNEFLILLTQLRHVLSAVRSNEAAVEDEDDVFSAFVAGELYLAAFAVAKLEIGGWLGLDYLDIAHSSISLPIVRSLARFLRMSTSACFCVCCRAALTKCNPPFVQGGEQSPPYGLGIIIYVDFFGRLSAFGKKYLSCLSE